MGGRRVGWCGGRWRLAGKERKQLQVQVQRIFRRTPKSCRVESERSARNGCLSTGLMAGY